MTMSAGNEQQGLAKTQTVTIGRHRYLRAPVPVRFPESAEVPESKLHLALRTLIYEVLRHGFAEHAAIGCDQFVYWDATSPRACLSPDAFVRLGQPDSNFKSWKVWERGAPEVAVEIVSDSDVHEEDWQTKLGRYARLGVEELVRFDPECAEQRLRIWDRIENDLVERELASPCAESSVLPGYWLENQHAALGPSLRLSHDSHGARLYPTEAEAHRAEAEAHRAKAEAAAQRIRELEAELARRQG